MKKIFLKIFTPLILGLLLSFIGTIILIIPNTFSVRNVNDEFITSINRTTGDYTQVKHEKEKKINIWGLSFLASGFLFQFVDTTRKK